MAATGNNYGRCPCGNTGETTPREGNNPYSSREGRYTTRSLENGRQCDMDTRWCDTHRRGESRCLTTGTLSHGRQEECT